MTAPMPMGQCARAWQTAGMKHSFVLTAALFLLPIAAPAFERHCDVDAGCSVGGSSAGTYHVALPDDWSAPQAGAQDMLVFYHGHGGSGRALIRNSAMIRTFTEAGYIVVAPDGVARPGSSTPGWAARPNPEAAGRRDNIAFTEAVIGDLKTRLTIEEVDLLVSGFSSGGSMAWMLACYSTLKIDAVVPVAGGLRRPNPDTACPAGPQRLLQIHGFVDRQVPLEGRGIGNWHQGDVFESLSLMRNTNGCESRPSSADVSDPYWCRAWTSCSSGREIAMCLHPGGHGLPKGWVQRALDWHQRAQD